MTNAPPLGTVQVTESSLSFALISSPDRRPARCDPATTRSEDVVRGLNLKLGEATTRQNLLSACDHFRQLKLFPSSQCHYKVHGHNVSLTVFVDEKWPGMPVVFDNFVWTTRAVGWRD